MRALIAVTLFSLGCGAAMDANSGGDHVRGKSAEIKFGQTHDDFISADKGDHTDWKKFVLSEPAVVAIHAYWDEPSVQIKVMVRDQFGGQVFSLDHSTGNPADHWTGMKLREGDYYLEVVSGRGSSVYTFELEFEEGGSDGGGSDGDVAPPE